MGLFSWFKKENSELTKKEIYIEGNRLFYHDHGNLEEVHLDQLKYAYVEILGEQPYLFLFDFQQRYILATQSGFMDVYLTLSDRFGFNNDVFKKVVKENIEDTKERIWIKPEKKNYQILDADFDDLDEGFEVLSNPPKFISWDTTYDEMLTLNVGEISKGSFDLDYFKFNNPVRIGRLVVDELEYYADNVRGDMAVEGYFATLHDDGLTDKSYHELRAYLKAETETSEEELEEQGHEREDQKYLNFYEDEIGFSICYTYAIEGSYDDGATSFSITNYRDYEGLLENENYDSAIELSEIVELSKLYEINENYRKNKNVKSIPKIIEQDYAENSIIWLDKKNSKIGFSGEGVALIYNTSEIEKVVVQNVLPAKGGGYSYLELLLINDQKVTVYYAEQNDFDDIVDVLETKFKLKVEVPEPYYNC